RRLPHDALRRLRRRPGARRATRLLPHRAGRQLAARADGRRAGSGVLPGRSLAQHAVLAERDGYVGAAPPRPRREPLLPDRRAEAVPALPSVGVAVALLQSAPLRVA